MSPRQRPFTRRALTPDPLTRRDLLRYAGAGTAAWFLAACSVGGGREDRSPTPTVAPSTLPPKTAELLMANWIAYIDKDHGVSKTLTDFREQFDVDMTYSESINDNDEFFGTDLREPLSQGQPTGWDIIVMTDWMIEKLIRLGYVQPLVHDALPNFAANAAEKFKDPWFDPGNAHSIPWTGGITGIGYNRALCGRDLTSIEDLFDPAFAGHVGMFKEMRDTYNFMLLTEGKDPTAATLDEIEQATQRLIEIRDTGQFRGFYGNDYLDQLGGGNLWATMAWSGDVFSLSLDNPDLAFIIPAEGGNRWSDNMCIPNGAANVNNAHRFMNYVYDVDVATRITEWVWYESPVAAVHQMIVEDAAETGDEILLKLSQSTTVFPDAETEAATHPYKRLDAEEEEAWLDLWGQVVQG